MKRPAKINVSKKWKKVVQDNDDDYENVNVLLN
jgi:hypothetical protein